MRIDVLADASIDRQTRIYAEYSLFAALSAVADTSRITRASLVLRRPGAGRHGASVLCTLTVELRGGAPVRLRAVGERPYAAINRAIERLRLQDQQKWEGSSTPELVAAE